MGSGDHQFHPRTPIGLDVTIIDPHGDEASKDVESAMNFKQSLLIEVWDDDMFKKDLLGEAWLPHLAEIGHNARDFVLPLNMPDFSGESENGPSRHHRTKEAYDVTKTTLKATGELYIKMHWQFPLYEVTSDGKCFPKDKTDGWEKLEIKDVAKQQEAINTGKLTLTIDHGRNLRRADASKGRDCDPQATVWLRNDVLGKWRTKTLHKTKTVKNNANPKWQHEVFTVDILQGDYESRFPPRDHTFFGEVKHSMQSKRTRRYEEEEKKLLAVKTFGEGVNIKFGAQMGRGEGESHRVEVYLGDSIREFKTKLTEACKMESAKSPDAAKYQGIAIAAGHLVMVFVPPAKLTQLVEEGNKNKPEYKHAYSLAIEDPSNWEPLDPTRTFDQYNPRFGFGREGSPPQILRVVEATEKYKMTNLNYQAFERERNKKLMIDTNEKESCFGYAKYTHKGDKSEEWRPALIRQSNGDAKQDPLKSEYSVSWLVPPAEEDKKKTLDRTGVLLAPKMPQMDHYVDPQHEQVLGQARSLRQIGKSDYEIEVMLNKILEEKQKEGAVKEEGAPPQAKCPRITVDIIKKYMAHEEIHEASTKKSE